MHLQHAQNTMEFAKFLRHPKCRVVFPQVFQICWMRYLKLYEHYGGAGDLDLPLEDSDLSLAFDRASFKMMGAQDGRGGPGATEIGAAGNLGRAAAAAGAEFENRPGGNGGLRVADTSG